jgi:flagellar biosynthesis/type III secretory pathway chaperone
MNDNTRSRSLIVSLEDILVQEFRAVQTLITITRDERQHLPTTDADILMALVEKKENLLDEMGLLEEKRRTTIQEIAASFGVQMKTSSVKELFPYLDPGTEGRLNRLSEGIASLVTQARDLNHGNHAMAGTSIEWLESTRAFLYGHYQNQVSYQPPGATPSVEKIPAWGIQHSI